MTQFSIDRRSLFKGAGALVVSIGIPGGVATAETGSPGSKTHKHNGLYYLALDDLATASARLSWPPDYPAGPRKAG